MDRLVGPADVLELVARAVAEAGADHVDPNTPDDDDPEAEEVIPVYFEDEGPSCLVGYVLSFLGVQTTDLDYEANVCPVTSRGMGHLDWRLHDNLQWALDRYWERTSYRLRFTPHAVMLLNVAQLDQDKGYAWGHVSALLAEFWEASQSDGDRA